jgi:hypothetical protein
MKILLAARAMVPAARSAGPALAAGHHHPPSEPLRIFASCENPRCTAAALSPTPRCLRIAGTPRELKSAPPTAPRPHTQSAWGPQAPAGGRSLRRGVVVAHRERCLETREGVYRIRSHYAIVGTVIGARALAVCSAVASRQQSSWAGRRPVPGGSDDERSHGWRERGAVQRGFSQDAKILSGPRDGTSPTPRGRHRLDKASAC